MLNVFTSDTSVDSASSAAPPNATSIGANVNPDLNLVLGPAWFGLPLENGSGGNSNKDSGTYNYGVIVEGVNVSDLNCYVVNTISFNPVSHPVLSTNLEGIAATNRKVLGKAVRANGDGPKEIPDNTVKTMNTTHAVTTPTKFNYVKGLTEGGAAGKANQIHGDGTKEHPYHYDLVTRDEYTNVTIATSFTRTYDGVIISQGGDQHPGANVGPLISDAEPNFVGSFDFMPGSATAKDYWESLVQKDVLYVAPGNEYDISAEILKRMNDKFQKEQNAKSANKDVESK